MKILKVEPAKAPYVKEIENELHAIQEEVGGDIEVVGMEQGVILCCNEEGKFNGMEPNRKVPGDIIYGPFFVVGAQGEDFASLSDEHIAYYTNVFADTSKRKSHVAVLFRRLMPAKPCIFPQFPRKIPAKHTQERTHNTRETHAIAHKKATLAQELFCLKSCLPDKAHRGKTW